MPFLGIRRMAFPSTQACRGSRCEPRIERLAGAASSSARSVRDWPPLGLRPASSADLVRRAWKSAPERGALLAPYAVWTGFATVLSAEIARLNRRH